MAEDVQHHLINLVTSVPGLSAIFGAIGWASYRVMSPKTLTVRRFIGGFIFAAFTGWIAGTMLGDLLPPDKAAAIGAALGSSCEKVRSLFIQKLEEKFKKET